MALAEASVRNLPILYQELLDTPIQPLMSNGRKGTLIIKKKIIYALKLFSLVLNYYKTV